MPLVVLGNVYETEIMLEGISPISAATIMNDVPTWPRGVRVHSENGSEECKP